MIDHDGEVATYQRHPLVQHVARNLRINLGDRAVPMAHQAIERMRNLCNEEGLTLWLAIHASMMEAEVSAPAADIVLH